VAEIRASAQRAVAHLAREVELVGDGPDRRAWEAAAVRLSRAAASRPFDRWIRLAEAHGAINAIGRYGAADRFEDLERWGRRLVALAEDPVFAGDREIRLDEARGAFNAILRYGEHGRTEARKSWFIRLAAVARAFPSDRDVQDAAGDAGVTSIQQRAAGWPHGAPDAPPAGG